MKNKILFIFIYKLFTIINHTSCSNILVFAPMPFKSHFSGFQPLFKELAIRGHNVTVLSSFPLKKPLTNYTDIPINVNHLIEGINPYNFAKHGFLTIVPNMWAMTTNLAQKILPSATIQNFIMSDDFEFDLIMVFTFYQEYALALGHKYSAPVINLGVVALWPTHSKWIGEPSTFSYILDVRTGATDQMSFYERIKNTIIGAYQLFLEDFYYLPQQKKIMNENFKYKGHEFRPSLEDMLRNVSVTLLNAHYSIGFSRPYTPGTIEIPGLHVNEPKPVTGKYLEFIESAKDGVIFFSFGTILDPSFLPNSTIEIFINVFKQLKQKVMWKWNSKDLPPLPDHIMVSDWFPQPDILGHPNVRLFITHGGVHSLQEATYNALPIVGIPFFGDQHTNMKIAEQNGVGKMVDNIDLNEQSLLSAVNEVLTDPKFKENSKLRSQIFKDCQIKPLDQAVYWVEYVIRNNGSGHLSNNSATLSYTQYFLTDVCFVIISSIIISIFLIVKATKLLRMKNVNQIKKGN